MCYLLIYVSIGNKILLSGLNVHKFNYSSVVSCQCFRNEEKQPYFSCMIYVFLSKMVFSNNSTLSTHLENSN